ncbi:VOC family protein [Nocardia sp. CA-290969]|uniref:VOC family protein n=1 Tax=Nocardia sp. CA-290969 TaxID=3239986 RepID=UPI003D948CB6
MNIEQITPKLVVEGADAAIRYYGEVFGAVLRRRDEADGRVVFARLGLPCGAVFELKDADEFDHDPLRLGGRGLLLTVVAGDPDALARRMVESGGEIVFEVADRPYGARQGRVRDPFGHEWIVGTPIPAAAGPANA